ncbi:MAG TPA: hypothetical protein VHQ01_12725, partial [Pyrinomonadaceae bacterium]|nr:hypothetical protein [Pyrinomonadaceae bacterium]
NNDTGERIDHFTEDSYDESHLPESERGITYRFADFARLKKTKKLNSDEANAERKTISEVLHDIYDENVQ